MNWRTSMSPPAKVEAGERSVRLRFPIGQHAAGAVVSFPVAKARGLIADGYAVAVSKKT